jgi:hypothetical protein
LAFAAGFALAAGIFFAGGRDGAAFFLALVFDVFFGRFAI